MKTLKNILGTLLLAFALSMGAYAQENQSYIMHTIEKGQTLTSISSMYGVSIDDIVKLNPGSDTTIIEGKQLRIPRRPSNQQGGSFHTIVSGETLYRLSQNYKVSVRAIMDANPGLSATNFKAGQVIRIPEANEKTALQPSQQQPEEQAIPQAVKPKVREMHKVKSGETIYSIAKKYGVTEEELLSANSDLKDARKLKKNSFLAIPYHTEAPAVKEEKEPTDKELFQANAETGKKLNSIKAAIILPFLKNGNATSETRRMLEYYQGFLLAIDSLKTGGANVDLYTYNSGSTVAEMDQLLTKPEMKDMNIIFGPMHTEQIAPLAKFAESNDIRLVIPFTSRDNTVYNNPQVYQVNTPQSYFYSEVYDHFGRQFPNAHVIFIESTETDKADFIKGFREDLRRRNIPITTLNESEGYTAMKGALRSDKENIFVPTSGSNTALIKSLPQLTLVVRDSLLNVTQGTENIHLFGYPEWQTYTNDFLESFFELDTYFYSSFYTNNLMDEPKAFIAKFRRWYGREMEDRYPKYGMLGFDTGYFFLKGLWLYGTAFDQNQSQLLTRPIQTGFKYERVNNWGGFINKKVFFVHFNRNNELIKLDFD